MFQIKLWKCFILLFNFVLTSYKGILQKISVRENPKFVYKNEIEHEPQQYLMNMYISNCLSQILVSSHNDVLQDFPGSRT